jgi:cytochrome c
MHRCGISVAVMVALATAPALVWADTAEDLAKESSAYCAQTAKDAAKLTPQMIIEKVDQACKLVEEKGVQAFAAFQGKDSPFIFCGTYIWVQDTHGVMRMHPIFPRLNGKSVLRLKDENDKLFFLDMHRLARDHGHGWVQYVWPKPGEEKVSPKTSYVKRVKHGDQEFVLGCGVYDWTLEQVQETLAE